jgi:hypothetical protein
MKAWAEKGLSMKIKVVALINSRVLIDEHIRY